MKIVYLEDRRNRMSANGHDPVPPKMETHAHGKHRYTLRFDPDAATSCRWTWCVKYTRVYEFIGYSPTIAIAAREARRKIDELNTREGMRA